MNYQADAPQPVREFLVYHDTIKGQSKATVDSYFLDLRTFTRYLMVSRNLVPRDTALEDIDIHSADLAFYGNVTLTEIYDFLAYLSRDRELNASSRARMITSLKGFYNYLTVKTKQLKDNPVQDLDTPKLRKTLPHYLTLEESQRLLSSVDGKNKERDYCILCLFLNCGLRISEMVGLNLTAVRQDSLLIHGKGNKERMVAITDDAAAHLKVLIACKHGPDPDPASPLFYTVHGGRKTRMSKSNVQGIVKKHAAGARAKCPDVPEHVHPHMFRRTRATDLYQQDVELELISSMMGHADVNTTRTYAQPSLEKQREDMEAANPPALGEVPVWIGNEEEMVRLCGLR